MKNQQNVPVRSLVVCALFAALSAALSQVSVPLGLVPVVMTHIAIFSGAGLLGWRLGALSQIVFIALGAVGLPVFAGFKGGIGHLFGATGGFIWGYFLSAVFIGLLADRFGRRWAMLPAMALGVLIIYLPGIPWFMHVTGFSLTKAIGACMLPYLPGDFIKAAASVVLVWRLAPVTQRLLHPRAARVRAE
ncbi:MAG: biotin transporter BioY [Oscillospiraceae bacterium]|jgi:biotin transport system substrate-specific component|nr:biotin transporter BioY [Oscillospiraceae bacterium]